MGQEGEVLVVMKEAGTGGWSRRVRIYLVCQQKELVVAKRSPREAGEWQVGALGAPAQRAKAVAGRLAGESSTYSSACKEAC